MLEEIRRGFTNASGVARRSEVPDRRTVVDGLPTGDARQERIHEREFVDLLRIHRA
jgi:hypothetical protein